MKKISSKHAFFIYVGVMLGGYIWATFLTAAPYTTLAEFLTIGASAYWGKRLLQKMDRFGGNGIKNGSNGKTPEIPNETAGCD